MLPDDSVDSGHGVPTAGYSAPIDIELKQSKKNKKQVTEMPSFDLKDV